VVVAAGSDGLTPARVCKRFDELKAQHCTPFDHMDNSQCEAEIGKFLADPNERPFAACTVEHAACDDVVQCIAGFAQQAQAGAQRTCGQQGESMVGIPAAEYEHRNGTQTHELAKASSSKEKPIETCGMDAESDWLDQATCPDGSSPARGKAEALRVGNIGVAGRCGSIVDLYRVPCGDQSYDVYMDAYICAQR
jgi:hypothetical protein